MLRYWRLLLLLGYASVMAWGLLRAEAPPTLFRLPNVDKLEHLLAFLLLGLGARLATPSRLAIPLWVTLLLLAPGMEILQGQLQTTRNTELLDALANTAGILLALMLWLLGEYGLRQLLQRRADTTEPAQGGLCEEGTVQDKT